VFDMNMTMFVKFFWFALEYRLWLGASNFKSV